MQPLRTEAIILRRTNYGEADRILSFLTPERGKLSAIAKGVRRPKSKLAGGLELFAVCDVTLIEGRGELGVVTSARIQKFYGDILHDYDRMQLGYEMIKHINRVTETVSEPDFYYLLRDGLKYLNELKLDWRLVELWFRLRFQALLGHGLNLATDIDSKPLEAESAYNFEFSDMAFVKHPSGKFKADHLKLLRLANIKNPAVLGQVSGVDAVMDDCLWLVRTFDQ
ncbi:MAG: DNA repair protein RecO [Candidatus Saccharimonadales bacterium]